MTWFKVDDRLHASVKAHAAGEAMALWVLAGSWCADQLTDGWISEAACARLMPRVWRRYARKLTAVGLWEGACKVLAGETSNGFQFHDWSDYQPTKEQVKADRASAADRQKRARDRAKSRRDGAESHAVRHAVTYAVSNGPPDPTRKDLMGGALSGTPTEGARKIDEPPLRCPQHIDTPTDAPCRACGDARRAHAAWEAADTERRRTWPTCRRHRGQPAHNCAPCRSEALAEPED